MTALTNTPAVNQAIAAANSLPQLIAALPPDMAAQLEGKPLLASRTPWGVALASLIGMAAAHYGIGLDSTATALLSGGLVLLCTVLGSYVMRVATHQPIVGMVATPAGQAAQ